MTRLQSPLYTVAAMVFVAGSVMSFSAFAGNTRAKLRPGTEQQTACAISPVRSPLGY